MDIVEPLSPMPASGTSDPSAATSGTARGTVGLLLPPRDDVIKVALSLYKVQQSIYLLDFQQIEVRPPIPERVYRRILNRSVYIFASRVRIKS